MKNERGNVVLVYLVIGALAALSLALTTDQIINNVYDSATSSMKVKIVGGTAGAPVDATYITQTPNTTLTNEQAISALSSGILRGATTTGVITSLGDVLPLANGGTGASSLTASRCLQTNAGGTAIEVAGAACGSGTGTVTGTGTTGLIPDWTSATALGDSLAYRISVTNDTVTGTTVNKLTKFTSAGKAIITAAAETSGVLGIVHSGAGTTGSAVMTTLGAESCVSDNATTAGHYATVSASVAGDCSDTGAATFPVAGTQVIGIWTETGVAGTRTLFFNTPDVASASSGGGGGGAKNPGGAAGDVQYRATGNNFAAEAAFNYNATNNQLLLTGATTATDNSTWMFSVAGTMPASPSATVTGFNFPITSAGSSSQLNGGMTLTYGAGYTGSSATRAATFTNAAVGTGSTLNLTSTTAPVGNFGVYALANAAGAGNTYGLVGDAGGSTGTAAGVYGRSAAAVAGNNIGGLFTAAASTEATDLKNVAVYGTLNSTFITGRNGSFALLLDGGTSPDGSSGVMYGEGTMSSASGGIAYNLKVTGAGSGATTISGLSSTMLAGYTGSASSRALFTTDNSLGTGTVLGLNDVGVPQTGNVGMFSQSYGASAATTAGLKIGSFSVASASTTLSVGDVGIATGTTAGTNVGVLGNANSSSEGTGFKNIAGWFTLDSTQPNAISDNVSVALVAASDGTADIFRGYSTTTKNISISAGGNVATAGTYTSSRTTDVGWTVQSAANQACNTTCTSACVVGFDITAAVVTAPLACTDATSDTCICAGSS